MNLSSRDAPPVRNVGDSLTNDTILNKCLEAIRAKRATIEECVQQYPEFAELGSLLRAAVDVYYMPDVGLSLSSKSAMREKILARYDAQPIRKPARTRSFNWRMWQRSAIALFTTLLILFAGGGSLLRAASQSIPGDMLYGLKRAQEKVQLSLADGPSRVNTLNVIANTRLDEVAVLVSRKNPLSDAMLSDVSDSVTEALKADPNVTNRVTLLDRTANVVQQATTSGSIKPEIGIKVMAAIVAGKSDGTDPAQPTAVPVKATLTLTPTATFTETPTETSTATPTFTATPRPTEIATETPDDPTVTPSPVFTDTPDEPEYTNTPKPTRPRPIQPTYHPTGVGPVVPTQGPPTSSAGNGNGGNGGNGNGNNGSGNGNGGGNGGNGNGNGK